MTPTRSPRCSVRDAERSEVAVLVLNSRRHVAGRRSPPLSKLSTFAIAYLEHQRRMVPAIGLVMERAVVGLELPAAVPLLSPTLRRVPMSSASSVTRLATPSTTTSIPSCQPLHPVVRTTCWFDRRFTAFCSASPVQKYTRSPCQTATSGVTCGRPSARTVVNHESRPPRGSAGPSTSRSPTTRAGCTAGRVRCGRPCALLRPGAAAGSLVTRDSKPAT